MLRTTTARVIGLALAMTATTLVATALPAQASPASAGCADVEVIGVRGTFERPGLGYLLHPLATHIQIASARSVSLHALVYPASLPYYDSVGTGIKALQARLRSQAAACPAQRFVILGYSQGAHVIGSSLDRRSTRLPASVQSRIVAVELFGDPTFRAEESYDRGTHQPDSVGIIARPRGALSSIEGITASWCDDTDGICQAGDYGWGHYGYGRHRSAAGAFALARIG